MNEYITSAEFDILKRYLDDISSSVEKHGKINLGTILMEFGRVISEKDNKIESLEDRIRIMENKFNEYIDNINAAKDKGTSEAEMTEELSKNSEEEDDEEFEFESSDKYEYRETVKEVNAGNSKSSKSKNKSSFRLRHRKGDIKTPHSGDEDNMQTSEEMHVSFVNLEQFAPFYKPEIRNPLFRYFKRKINERAYKKKKKLRDKKDRMDEIGWQLPTMFLKPRGPDEDEEQSFIYSMSDEASEEVSEQECVAKTDICPTEDTSLPEQKDDFVEIKDDNVGSAKEVSHSKEKVNLTRKRLTRRRSSMSSLGKKFIFSCITRNVIDGDDSDEKVAHEALNPEDVSNKSGATFGDIDINDEVNNYARIFDSMSESNDGTSRSACDRCFDSNCETVEDSVSNKCADDNNDIACNDSTNNNFCLEERATSDRFSNNNRHFGKCAASKKTGSTMEDTGREGVTDEITNVDKQDLEDPINNFAVPRYNYRDINDENDNVVGNSNQLSGDYIKTNVINMSGRRRSGKFSKDSVHVKQHIELHKEKDSYKDVMNNICRISEQNRNSEDCKAEKLGKVINLGQVFREKLEFKEYITGEMIESLLNTIPFIHESKISCKDLFCADKYEKYVSVDGKKYKCSNYMTEYRSLKYVEFPEMCKSLNIIDLSYMFYGCTSLEHVDLRWLNTCNVVNMREMFGNCSSLEYIDLSTFKTANVRDMSHLFNGCSKLTALDLSSFDTSNVTDMSYMFAGGADYAMKLTSINVSSFNTSNVTDMSGMFFRCSRLSSIDLKSFDTSKVQDMNHMFYWCSELPSLDLATFVTSSVKDMSYMFYSCSNIKSLDLSSFNTFSVTDMSYMFCWCISMTWVHLKSFSTANVNNMSNMFSECLSLNSLDLSSFITSNVKDMSLMFNNCFYLGTLDLSLFNTSNVTNMKGIFDECRCLVLVTCSSDKSVIKKLISKLPSLTRVKPHLDNSHAFCR